MKRIGAHAEAAAVAEAVVSSIRDTREQAEARQYASGVLAAHRMEAAISGGEPGSLEAVDGTGPTSDVDDGRVG